MLLGKNQVCPLVNGRMSRMARYSSSSWTRIAGACPRRSHRTHIPSRHGNRLLISYGHLCRPVCRPWSTAHPRLVLGSMPGEVSLRRQQYYAHPRNAFWRIMSDLIAVRRARRLFRRLARICSAAGIGLWDVLRISDRRGSLDSAIVADTMEVNDFGALFTAIARAFRGCSSTAPRPSSCFGGW